MSLKRKRTTAETARRYLSGGGVLREDSDDELGLDDLPWEWMYDEQKAIHEVQGKQEKSKRRNQPAAGPCIVGARMGSFEVRIGDTVLLKADGNEAWVGLVCHLYEDLAEEEKMATFMWFSSEREIRSKKKRSDALGNELYITPSWDDNPLTTINGKARIVSLQSFNAQYPTGKVPRTSRDYGKIFVCRRGCNTRTATYTDEFVWEDIYHGADDILALTEFIQSRTKATRKRAGAVKADRQGRDDFVARDEEDEDGQPKTPRKRRKFDGASTPTSRYKDSPRKFTTPTHRRIITKKALEFTPLGTRVLSPTHTTSPFQLVRTTLHVSAVPSSLPCREDEFATVYTHLEAAITAGTGSCIYISGTPGTGKTATVREVVAQLNQSVLAEELDDFIFVEINGMKVTDPHQSYSLLWEALRGDRVSPSHALELLEREFSAPSPRRVPCVVLMDELDQLVTRNQSVMYNFFNWPQLRHSRLIVLAVANTMDLPERTLSNKISSRLGLTRITFPGYTHMQLISIITSRLENVPGAIVHPDAIQFASRKVAAVSGDARRALDICRRAVEIAEAETLRAEGNDIDSDINNNVPNTPSKTPGRTKIATANTAPQASVTIATVKRAIAEATSTPLAASLRALPLASKLFLAALLARIRRTGIAEAVLGDVVDEARRIALLAQSQAVDAYLLTPPPELGEDSVGDGCVVGTPAKRGRPAGDKGVGGKAARVLGMGGAAVLLAEAGIVGLEARRGERVGRVRLGVAEEDVRGALAADGESAGLGFGG